MTDDQLATEVSEALDALCWYCSRRELVQALWMVIRLSDPDDDRPLAVSLALLVSHLNTVRKLSKDAPPLAPAPHHAACGFGSARALERLKLACEAAAQLPPTVKA